MWQENGALLRSESTDEKQAKRFLALEFLIFRHKKKFGSKFYPAVRSRGRAGLTGAPRSGKRDVA
jgi:hypothetical protein